MQSYYKNFYYFTQRPYISDVLRSVAEQNMGRVAASREPDIIRCYTSRAVAIAEK